MEFMNAMQNELNKEKTLTTNGAVAYRTSGKKLLDFNFAISALRNESEFNIANLFAQVFYEDKMTAIKFLFYLGDVRGGLGERRTFRICMKWLAESNPEITKKILELIPEYTRWDNLIFLVETKQVGNDVVKIIRAQLFEDSANMENDDCISLLAKWMPSANSNSKEKRRLGLRMAKELEMSERDYRKMLSSFRRYLDIVEIKMSQNKWDEIKYESVPSKANLRYNKAFLKHDEERRRSYLDSLRKGETKINANVLYPHEIVSKYLQKNDWGYSTGGTKDMDDTLEEMWKSLPNMSIENTLVVRDGSGSMFAGSYSNVNPIDVSTALAIYMSEHNTGEWKDKFITFSANPKIVNLSKCSTLKEKIDLSMCETEASNTNIYKTMKLILDTAINNCMTQEEMPKTIVICSDMQFDGRLHKLNKSLFDDIALEYETHGYKLPKICFWNLDAEKSNSVPMQQNEMGLVLCSSFSTQVLKMFMSGQTDPYKCLLEQLNDVRYKPVEEAIESVIDYEPF